MSNVGTRRQPMKIQVQELDGTHRLMVRSFAGLNPAGWRLQRSGYFPITQFEFFDENEAGVAAIRLQEYLNKA